MGIWTRNVICIAGRCLLLFMEDSIEKKGSLFLHNTIMHQPYNPTVRPTKDKKKKSKETPAARSLVRLVNKPPSKISGKKKEHDSNMYWAKQQTQQKRVVARKQSHYPNASQFSHMSILVWYRAVMSTIFFFMFPPTPLPFLCHYSDKLKKDSRFANAHGLVPYYSRSLRRETRTKTLCHTHCTAKEIKEILFEH